jgi:hypothetical protein
MSVTIRALPISLGLLLFPRDAAACSCVPPEPQLLSPERSVAAPLNTKIVVLVPSHLAGRLELARVGAKTKISAREQRRVLGDVIQLEISPASPLEPGARYSVSWVDPSESPSTLVFGSFKTADMRDDKPPSLAKLGTATPYRLRNPMGSMCQTAHPWVEISAVEGSDPGRAQARLLYAVWVDDGTGKLNTKLPPSALLPLDEKGVLRIGNASLCTPLKFPFPNRPQQLVLAIAAVDEAGNTSPARSVRVALGAAQPPKQHWP